ncbi:MAG: menaquinone biosynthesis decarboxylase [bacterium]
MAFHDLKQFMAELEKKGELVRIREEVSCDLEITEITDRVSKSGPSGPALLFERVTGHTTPVLMNAFGSMSRVALALGLESEEAFGHVFGELMDIKVPAGWMNKLRLLPKLKRFLSLAPKVVKNPPCQQVVYRGEEAALSRIPVLFCWPADGGRFITLPTVFSRHPVTGKRNVGMYRMHVYDDRTTGMHWHTHKGGAEHYREAERLNQRLEVAVAIGPGPAVTYAATAPIPPDMDEIQFAAFLQNAPIEMARCLTIDQEVPAHAQFVLEGYVEPKEQRIEGPFGDHTGYYSPADSYPVFHLTCITHQKDPVYPATIVGKPPMEDCYLAKATERIFLPLIQAQLPEVTEFNLPMEGVFHNLALVSIKKTYPGQAKKVMSALWGMGQMMFTKIIVVFESDVDVHNMSDVLWRLGNDIDPRRDVIFFEGPVDALDHAASSPHLGSKMGIDATKKWREEGYPREWPDVIRMDPAVVEKVDRLWPKLGIDLP